MNQEDKFCFDCTISITKSILGYLEHHLEGVERYKDGYVCHECHKKRSGKARK